MTNETNCIEFGKYGSSFARIARHIRKAAGFVFFKDKNLFYRFNSH